jgi:hypothetical protein
MVEIDSRRRSPLKGSAGLRRTLLSSNMKLSNHLKLAWQECLVLNDWHRRWTSGW